MARLLRSLRILSSCAPVICAYLLSGLGSPPAFAGPGYWHVDSGSLWNGALTAPCTDAHSTSAEAVRACIQAIVDSFWTPRPWDCPRATVTLTDIVSGASSIPPQSDWKASVVIWGQPNQCTPGPPPITPLAALPIRLDDPVSCENGLPWSSSSGACEPRDCLPTGDCAVPERPLLSCNASDLQIGNPCNLATGAKTERHEDYRSPTGLVFVRAHDSRGNIDYGFGRGWTTNFHKRIEVQSDFRSARRGDGRREPFVSVAGAWQPPADSDFALTEDATGYTLDLRDGSSERYDLDGRIISETNAAGQTTTFAYDVSGQLETVTGHFGNTLTFAYVGGHLSTLTTPTGVIGYAYNGNRLTSVTYEDTSQRIYHYENALFSSALTGVSYREASGTTSRYSTFSYYNNGKAKSTEHAGGTERFTLNYNSSVQTTVTDAASTVEVNVFGSQLDVNTLRSSTNQVDGKTLTQTFDSNNNLACRKDAEGRVTTYTYNGSNQRTSTTYGRTGTCASPVNTSATRTTSFTYLASTLDLPSVITESSVYATGDKTTTLNYDDMSHPTLPTEIVVEGYTPSGVAVSRAVALTYGADGQVTEIDGPRTDVSDVTTLTYYDCTTGAVCGQLESVTNALSQVTMYDSYSDDGRVTQVTDPNGLVTTIEYDDRGRVTAIEETPPSGPARTTSYEYNAAGNVTSATRADGFELTYTYDAAQQLTRVTDNNGNYVEYDYDSRGDRINESTYDVANALKHEIDVAYDIRNRIEFIDVSGSVTALVQDAVGNFTDETDPNSNDTEHGYDALNRLIETIDALSGVTTLGYDVNDELVSVEAPNGATTMYVYDDLGNLLSTTSPDTGTTTYTYDAAGNRLTQTDANSVTVEYTYDALNRLTSIEYPNSALNVTFEYDQGTNQKGFLTTLTDGSGTTTFAYDAFGNLTQESKSIDGNTHVTAYGYDAADLLTSITYPSGRTVAYTRNVLGEIEEVETAYGGSTVTIADDVEHEPFGPLSTLTFGNGLVLTRTFDQQYRLTEQTTGAIQDLTFTLDAAGNVDAIVDAVNASLSRDFDQDALHRIDFEDGAYGTIDYTYDANGNRLTKVLDDGSLTTQTLTYATDSNRLATHDGQTVTLDAAGNTTADPAQALSFGYDDHNRMVAAYVGGVLKATYVYNGHGQRVKKVEATGAQRTTVYHYGLSGELLGETIYGSGGAKIGERDYLWLDSLPLAQSERTFSGGAVTSSQLVYIHADQLSTPRLATNPSGTVVWRWDSDAFGVGDADTDPDSDTNLVNVRLRFPGQYFDEETGLHYNYFRDYDAETGRYMQHDPIGLDGGLNPYLYVDGNPLRYFDSLGLAKGGRKNLGTEGFTRHSSPKDVEAALQDAIKKGQRKRVAALRALLKVIKRGGSMSVLPFFDLGGFVLKARCAAGELGACQTLCTFYPEECKDLDGASCPPEA